MKKLEGQSEGIWHKDPSIYDIIRKINEIIEWINDIDSTIKKSVGKQIGEMYGSNQDS